MNFNLTAPPRAQSTLPAQSPGVSGRIAADAMRHYQFYWDVRSLSMMVYAFISLIMAQFHGFLIYENRRERDSTLSASCVINIFYVAVRFVLPAANTELSCPDEKRGRPWYASNVPKNDSELIPRGLHSHQVNRSSFSTIDSQRLLFSRSDLWDIKWDLKSQRVTFI